jgi:hypothetical protein
MNCPNGRIPFHDNYAMYDADDLEFLERRRLWATGCQHPDDCQPDYCGCDSMPIDPDL